MSSLPKNDRHCKSIVNCALGEKCARRKCSFKHPEGWNVVANERKVRQQRLEDHDFLQQQQQQRRRLNIRCRQDELCRRLDCPYQHSRHWNPKRNQQLYEEKRRRDEQRREEQRKHAYNVSIEQMTEEEENEFSDYRKEKILSQDDLIDEEYVYDDEYFDIQEKVWAKQSAHSTY